MTRTREQVIWDFVQGWLKNAEDKLVFARHGMGEEFQMFDTTLLYAHLSVVRSIIALLVWRQIPYKKCPTIAGWAGLLSRVDNTLALDLAAADWLTPYGDDFPDAGTHPVDRAMAQKAIEEAERVRGLVMAQLGGYLSRGRPPGV